MLVPYKLQPVKYKYNIKTQFKFQILIDRDKINKINNKPNVK